MRALGRELSRCVFGVCVLGLVAAAAHAAEVDPLLDRSNWVWWDKDPNGYYKAAGTDPAIVECAKQPFTFTREIEIAADVQRATMRVSAQNLYVLSVNGREVGRDNNWMSLETYDLKPFLVKGKNKLEVKAIWAGEYEGMKAVDGWWAPGAFFFARIATTDGKELEVLADESWGCTNAAGMSKKAEIIVQGVDGGYWNNCNRVFEMPALWYRLNTELATPNIPWAKPYSGGKIKVLAILPRSMQHDLVELFHRADLAVQHVFTDINKADARYGGTRAPFFPEIKGARRHEVAAAVGEALAGSPDVVVLLGIRSDVFYEVAAARLKTMLQDGVGLVYTAMPHKEIAVAGKKRKQRDKTYEKELTASKVAAPPGLLATSVPFEELPGFKLGPRDKERGFQKVASLHQYGQGRVARLRLGSGRYASLANAADPNDLHYEYYQSFVIKTVLWAARREPAVQFREFPMALTTSRDEPGELTFGLTGKGRLAVKLAIRSRQRLFVLPGQPLAGGELSRGEAVLRPLREAETRAKAGTPVRFALPRLPAGEYFLDVQVLDGKDRANWATAHLTVRSTPAIAGIEMASPAIDVADGKAAAVQARVALTEGAPDRTTVHFALVDNYDRLLQQQEIEVEPGDTAAEAAFLVRRFRTCLGKVRAELRVGREAADIAVARFTAIRRDWDNFGLFATYGGWGGSHLGNIRGRVMADLGFDAGFVRMSLDTLEAADLLPITGTYGINPRRAIDLDPGRMEQLRQKMRAGMKAIAPFDPVAYVCGDELNYGGGREFPSRVADYRDFLERKYVKVQNLNRQWGTELKSFDDVYPLLSKKKIDALGKSWEAAKEKGLAPPGIDPSKFVPEEEYKERAAAAGNYSQYIDLWRNNYRVFADQYRLATAMAKESNPYARIGSWAPMWPWAHSAHDWATFVQDMECLAPYGRGGEMLPMESARSFAPPTTMTGLCYGGYLYMGFPRRTQLRDLEWQKWRIWSGLLRGFTSVWWYSMGHGGNESGMSPGVSPYPCLRVASAEAARMRQGFYHVFTRARRQYGPVALHYSIPSRLMGSLIPNFNRRPWDFHFLLRIMQDHVGQQYTFVSSEQIAKGELSKYKVLMMPLSMAIDAAEAKAMAAFVREGGLLIADVRPGLANGHGNLNDNKLMSELFGVTYRKELGRKLLVGQVSGDYRGVAFRNDEQKLPADPALELKGAKALLELDGTPLVVCNDVGKGSAVCLNIPFNYYRGYPTPDHMYKYFGEPGHNRMLGNVIAAILKAHKIERPVQVEGLAGDWMWGLDTPYHVDGEVQYVSLTKRRRSKREQGGYEISVRPPKGGHVYDMDRGKYLGLKDSWPVKVAAADVQLFSVLPYKVDGLSVALSDRTVASGRPIKGTVTVDTGNAPPARHFVHLRVVRPDGKDVRYLARTLETADGAAKFSLPTELNAPAGTYKLRCTDAATGTATSAEVRVRP